MGADLYINKLTKNLEKKWESEDGYFRDAYNHTNVLWTLNLSYWNDLPKYLNRQGNLAGSYLKDFRELVATSPQTLPKSTKTLHDWHLEVDNGKNNLDAWCKYFVEKRQRLLDFLDLAIELRSSISCSI